MHSPLSEKIEKTDFGKIDDQDVYLFTLTNKAGNKVTITNYGGIVTGWITTDKNGNQSSIVAGFNELGRYIPNEPNFGSLIGRYANRIANGKFKLGDNEYTLASNNGENHLHGGIKSFSRVVWSAAIDKDALLLSYLSRDGEEGYPGNVSVTVSYCYTDEDELIIEYNAVTDKPTVINLTSHCYFNLTGNVNNNVLDHVIQINADNYTPVNEQTIPTGEIAPVKGTPFDLRLPKKIGDKIMKTNEGYDHNYVLNNPSIAACAVVVTEAISGRTLAVYTDQPGVQFYTGNFLDGTYHTDDGAAITKHTAFCIETQHFPDSPNKPAFPSTMLHPREQYHTLTKYKLWVK